MVRPGWKTFNSVAMRTTPASGAVHTTTQKLHWTLVIGRVLTSIAHIHNSFCINGTRHFNCVRLFQREIRTINCSCRCQLICPATAAVLTSTWSFYHLQLIFDHEAGTKTQLDNVQQAPQYPKLVHNELEDTYSLLHEDLPMIVWASHPTCIFPSSEFNTPPHP